MNHSCIVFLSYKSSSSVMRMLKPIISLSSRTATMLLVELQYLRIVQLELRIDFSQKHKKYGKVIISNLHWRKKSIHARTIAHTNINWGQKNLYTFTIWPTQGAMTFGFCWYLCSWQQIYSIFMWNLCHVIIPPNDSKCSHIACWQSCRNVLIDWFISITDRPDIYRNVVQLEQLH